MIPYIKTSFYYNFMTTREQFNDYYSNWHNNQIAVKNTKNGFGPIAIIMEQSLSNPMTQKCISQVDPIKGMRVSKEHPSYEKNRVYICVSLFRNCMKMLSGIFPGLKKY